MAEAYEPPEWRACHGSDTAARTVPTGPLVEPRGVTPYDLSRATRTAALPSASGAALVDLARDRDRWRLLFAALLARGGVATEAEPVRGTVKLSWQEIEAARALVLVEWPVVEASHDYTVYRAGDAP